MRCQQEGGEQCRVHDSGRMHHATQRHRPHQQPTACSRVSPSGPQARTWDCATSAKSAGLGGNQEIPNTKRIEDVVIGKNNQPARASGWPRMIISAPSTGSAHPENERSQGNQRRIAKNMMRPSATKLVDHDRDPISHATGARRCSHDLPIATRKNAGHDRGLDAAGRVPSVDFRRVPLDNRLEGHFQTNFGQNCSWRPRINKQWVSRFAQEGVQKNWRDGLSNQEAPDHDPEAAIRRQRRPIIRLPRLTTKSESPWPKPDV